MWVRGAAIRPVPPYAVVSQDVLAAIEHELAESGSGDNPEIEDAFARFERTQPHLAQFAADVLQKPLDETALALGYFLNIVVWLAFERAFGERLAEVSEGQLEAAQAAVSLEEELRATHSEEPLDVDDVMAIEQPAVLSFLNEHVDAALEPTDEAREVDVDDVHAVYHAALVVTLALSHGVRPAGAERAPELLA